MPAAVGFANWQIPLMIGAPDMAFARNEQLELLAAPPRRDHADRLVLRARRRGCRRLDAVPAAVGAGRHGPGPHDLRRPHHGASSIMGSINIITTISTCARPA